VRKLPALIVLAFALALAHPSLAAIEWIENDLIKGEQIARDQKKPLLLFFHTEWCSWCAVYERKVFTDDDVTDRSNFFVPVKIEYDVRGKNKLVVKRFKVTAFPTILVVSPEGKVLGRLSVYRPPEAFLAFLDECVTPGESLPDLDARIAAGANSPALLIKSADRHLEGAELDEAERRYTQAAQGDPDGRIGLADDALIGIARVKTQRGDSAGALAQYRKVLRDYPSSDRVAEAFVGALAILRDEGGAEEIDKLFAEFGPRFPDDPAVLNDHAIQLLDTGRDVPLAMEKIKKAVSLAPGTADYVATLARAQLASGHASEALESITAAIAKKPEDKNFRLLRLDILEAVRSKSPKPAPGAHGTPAAPH
jgi:thioredoxin-related protein